MVESVIRPNPAAVGPKDPAKARRWSDGGLATGLPPLLTGLARLAK
jgi:hypothetical protein